MRGTGRTTKQIQDAPKNAIYIWLNNHIDYPKRLAKELGRIDLTIVPSDRLTNPERWNGMPVTGVVIDHAVHMTEHERRGYVWLLEYMEIKNS